MNIQKNTPTKRRKEAVAAMRILTAGRLRKLLGDHASVELPRDLVLRIVGLLVAPEAAPRGRPAGMQGGRDYRIWERVTLQLQAGAKRSAANQDAAEHFNLDARSVDRIVREKHLLLQRNGLAEAVRLGIPVSLGTPPRR